MAFLADARRKRSVWQKMDENQTAFSVRTEIHFRADGYRNREQGRRCFSWRSLFFSSFFIRLKKKENPRSHAYLCI